MIVGGISMIVKITSNRQVTLPEGVLDTLGIGPGDRLELIEGPGDGFTLRPRRVEFAPSDRGE